MSPNTGLVKEVKFSTTSATIVKNVIWKTILINLARLPWMAKVGEGQKVTPNPPVDDREVEGDNDRRQNTTDWIMDALQQ